MPAALRLLGLAAVVWTLAGCAAPLPEEGSPSAALYTQRCGRCHRLYQPRVLTSKMWEQMVGRMDTEIRRGGLPPLSPEERQDILAYLQRNAGTH